MEMCSPVYFPFYYTQINPTTWLGELRAPIRTIKCLVVSFGIFACLHGVMTVQFCCNANECSRLEYHSPSEAAEVGGLFNSQSHCGIWICMTISTSQSRKPCKPPGVRQIGDRGSCWLRWKWIDGASRVPKRETRVIIYDGTHSLPNGFLIYFLQAGGPSTFESALYTSSGVPHREAGSVEGSEENSAGLAPPPPVWLHFMTVWENGRESRSAVAHDPLGN